MSDGTLSWLPRFFHLAPIYIFDKNFLLMFNISDLNMTTMISLLCLPIFHIVFIQWFTVRRIKKLHPSFTSVIIHDKKIQVNSSITVDKTPYIQNIQMNNMWLWNLSFINNPSLRCTLIWCNVVSSFYFRPCQQISNLMLRI